MRAETSKSSQGRQLLINVLASHANSLYGLVVGLLTGRWALLSLGHESYGLLGLVGGLIAFVTLFNMVFTNAIVRYYSVAIGKAQSGDARDIENCQRWFNVILFIHVVTPVVLLIVGYPFGIWMVRQFLEIPPSRVEECVWVFRFTCLTCLIGMMNVPIRAMYFAKQRIAELMVYGFIQSTTHLFVLWYFINHPGNWLVPIASWYFIQQFSLSLIQAIRALLCFQECRLVPRYMFDFARLRNLSLFAGWQFLGALGMMLRDQGSNILINKFLGPTFNATAGIANSISGHAQMFAHGVNSAFAPAISTAFGANDRVLMSSLVKKCDKFSTLLVIFLVLPLSLEMEYVVTLWLGNPPPCVAQLAVCTCGVAVLDKLTCGHEVAINASGKIAKMQMFLFIWYLGVAALSLGAFIIGGGIVWVGLASMVMMGCISFTRIVIVQRLLEFRWQEWFFEILIPLVIVTLFPWAIGCCIKIFMPSSLLRVVTVVALSSLVLIVLSWQFILSAEERIFVMTQLKKRIKW